MPTSNVHVLPPAAPRTAAERGLVDAFGEVGGQLPGSGWVSGVRRRAMRQFEALGLPSRRVEAYKYTDLRERVKAAYAPAVPVWAGAAKVSPDQIEKALGPLSALSATRIVLVDGVLRAELSDLAALAGPAEVMALGPLLAKAPAWLEGKFSEGRLGEATAMASLNTAFMSDGILLKIKPGQKLDKPVLLVSARSSAEALAISPRNIIAVEAGAEATLIEAYVSLDGATVAGMTNVLADVTIAEGGRLEHIKCASEGGQATHLSTWVVKVATGATYRGFQLTAGQQLARNEILVELAGADAKLDVSGAFLARGTSHIDTTLVVDHMRPGGESRELFKGVLDGRARGVFQGKIIVRPGADKTDGKQMARALLLSEDAEFDSKPELEIYADDVACGHGATAASLDEDLMFYCRSRGIPEAEAHSLLIEAFIGDAIDKVEREDVREALMSIARSWLLEGAASAAGTKR